MSDLKALARDLRAAGQDVVTAANRAGESTAQVVLKAAREQSSGTVKAHQFRERTGDDHPFAKRHGTPLLPVAVLNVQSGRLLESWEIRRIVTFNGQILYVVRNSAPYAQHLQFGTKSMFARPLVPAIQAKTRGTEQAFFELELTALLTRRFRG